MALAIVVRIPSLTEAQIATGALRSSGIDAELFDANFGRMEAPVIEALGGYRIMAPEGQVADARDLLRLIRANPGFGEPEDTAPWTAAVADSRRMRTRGMRMVAMLFLGIPAIIWLVRMLVH